MLDYQEDFAKTSIVEVTWEDHVIFTNPSWRDAAEELKPATIKSVGYVLRDTEKNLELVETLDTEHPISGNHRTILKSTISNIRVLNGT